MHEALRERKRAKEIVSLMGHCICQQAEGLWELFRREGRGEEWEMRKAFIELQIVCVRDVFISSLLSAL